ADQIDTNLANHQTNLTTRADGIDTKIDNVDADMTTRADTIDSAIASVDTNLTARADSIDAKLAQHQANLTHRTNQIDARLDDLTNTVQIRSNTRQIQIYRTAIEQALLNYYSTPIALFQIPAANGGRLEQVREVVDDAIRKALGAGLGVGSARDYFAH